MHTTSVQHPYINFRAMPASASQRPPGCLPIDVVTQSSCQVRQRSTAQGRDAQHIETFAQHLEIFEPCRASKVFKSSFHSRITGNCRAQKNDGRKSGLPASKYRHSESAVEGQAKGQAGFCQPSWAQRRPKYVFTCFCLQAFERPSSQLLESSNGESTFATVSNSSEPESDDKASLVGTVRWRGVLLALTSVLLCLMWRGPPSALAAAADGGGETGVAAFNFGAFGLRGSLTDRTPGLAYFALLMAAGCGLFVSEEALNVWVGGSLGRCLIVGGTREALVQSLRANGSYIASVIFWVYWGVCLSDLIPFFAGKWAAQRGESMTEKMGGTSKSTLARVTATVRKYGKYIGFVERFSLGVRNPTAFLAGFSGVSTGTFFAGVCAGGALTLPLQMGLGFVLRDRPVAALATVAAIVGTWTVIPYASAAVAAAWFFVKQRLDKNGENPSET